jgi:hypothetical protein
MDTEIIDVDSTELERHEPLPGPLTLFGTSDPTLALERMATMAGLLVDVVRERNLVKRISGSEYLLAPAWAVLGGMTGLAPYTVWTRRLDDGTGYLARVEVRRVSDGAVISAAEQVCARSEPRWAKADDHALLGMAQTRASSRALRGPLMQIVELAGYKGTPAEEMPVDQHPTPRERDDMGRIPPNLRPNPEQRRELCQLLNRLAVNDPHTDWPATAREIAGVPGDMLTRTIAAVVIDNLRVLVEAQESRRADDKDDDGGDES